MEAVRELLANTRADCPIDMSAGNFTSGMLVFVGSWISYIPQMMKIHRKRTHIGLNFLVRIWFLSEVFILLLFRTSCR